MPGGGSYLETARLAVTIRELPRQSDFSKPPFFNGGLPFIVWNPACCRVSWRIQMIKVPLTVLGAEQLKTELQRLKSIERPSVIAAIAEARSHGDLSENSEYDEAKNTQGLVENRITELEQMVKNAVIIDESELSVDSVAVGTHVSIKMIGDDEAEEYDIVGRTEADPINGKISDESPVGHALLGKAVGEKAEVLLPSGQTVEYEVLAITHAAN
jgi:transcription elongation factor GreA